MNGKLSMPFEFLLQRRLCPSLIRVPLLVLTFLLVLVNWSAVFAGGPAILRSDSVPYRWDSTYPVPFIIDNGPLGPLSRDEAADIVRAAFSQWEAVETADLTFEDRGFLELDLNGLNYQVYFDGHMRPDNPIVFDADGTILENLLGKGASDFVSGFSSTRFLDPDTGTFLSSWVILNGRNVTAERLARVVLHEIGHVIGLDHTQAGKVWAESLDPRDNARVPIMYPFLVRGGLPELRADDRSWASWLYPAEGFLDSSGAIQGSVTRANGEPVIGAHVVAVRLQSDEEHSVLTPTSESVSAVSGLLGPEKGSFLIPGLQPGKYWLYIEPLDTRFRGISSIQLAEEASEFPVEYYNGFEESGTHLDPPEERRLLTVKAGDRVTGIHFITNDLTAPLIFPARVSTNWTAFAGSLFAGSILNGSEEPNQLRMEIRDQDGVVRQSILRMVSPQMQETLQSQELLAEKGGPDLLWTIEGSHQVRSFFFAGSRDLSRVEGMGGQLRESRHLFYPLVKSNAESSTLIYLVNSQASKATSVILRLRHPSGAEIASQSISLEGGGYVASPLDHLFDLQEPLTDAYLEVESNIPLRGFAFIGEPFNTDLLTAQPALPTREFFAPHFLVDRSGSDTEVRVLNAGSETVELRLVMGHSQGETAHQFTVEAGRLVTISLKELVAPAGTSLSGSLQIVLQGGHSADLLGSLTIKGPAGRFRTSSPLAREGRYSVLFPHVAQSSQLHVFTGLALFNPSSHVSYVQVHAFDHEGARTALAKFSIGPGSRVVGMLNEALFFGRHFEQIGGHLEILSSCPIVTSGLFGSNSAEYLATLQGQDTIH